MLNQIAGGIGLFLLGMILLTDGLKALAGEALRRALVRFTGGPFRAMASGAAATAVLQSSSATVLTTIGFVSAGLLTFTQAVGVILGANLGTTSTGWIVSLVGLKLSLGTIALPVVGVGALLRLLGTGRLAATGMALAGFGLIFVGIDTLQSGMQVLAGRIDPAAFPGETFAGRLLLVGVGAVMTVVMQSSSAAIATTLAAVHSGAVDLHQAAALVIGQNIGTTLTAALAAIGASTAARRTALAHILFNAFAAVLAFLLLPALTVAEPMLDTGAGGLDAATLIAAFHTGFNLLGVIVIVPLARPFADLIVRLVPERGPTLTRHLDASVARVPQVAIEAARRTVMEAGLTLVAVLRERLERPDRPLRPANAESLDAAAAALRETSRFLGLVNSAEGASEYERELAVLHSIDHLDRLAERLRGEPIHLAPASDMLRRYRATMLDLDPVTAWLAGGGERSPAASIGELSRTVADDRREQRQEHLRATAAGRMAPDVALAEIDAMRWLDACLYHLWRSLHHAEQAGRNVPESGGGTGEEVPDPSFAGRQSWS